MPNLSVFTSVATIGERSEATPGLFNRIMSIVSQNVDQLNADAGVASGMTTLWFNVKNYGTGSDNTAILSAFSAAKLAGGGIVYIPTGTYTGANLFLSGGTDIRILGEGPGSIISVGATGAWQINGGLRVSVENLTFNQSDMQLTQLIFNRRAPGVLSSSDTIGIGIDNAVRNCRFLMNTAAGNPNVACVGIHDQWRTTVENNYCEYTRIAVISKYSQTLGSIIRGNYCVQKGTDTAAEAIKMDRAAQARVENNRIDALDCADAIIWNGEPGGPTGPAICANNVLNMTGTYTAGIIIGGSGSPVVDLRVHNNTILSSSTATPTAGIYGNDSTVSNVIISNNHLARCNIQMISNQSYVQITNNSIWSVRPTSGAGITIQIMEGAVTDNVIHSSQDGIVFNSVASTIRTKVSGNAITDFTQRGINMTKCGDCLISDNYIYTAQSAASYGIWCQDNGSAVNLNSRVIGNHVKMTGTSSTALRIESCDGISAYNNWLSATTQFAVASIGTNVFIQGYLLDPSFSTLSGGLFPDNSLSLGTALYRLNSIRIGTGGIVTDGVSIVSAGQSVSPGSAFSSEISLGWYRSGVSTLALSYGSFNLNQARTVSMRTLAASSLTPSAANTNTAVNECGFTVGGASGASFWINSGGTTYIFNSAISASNA